VVKHQLKKGSGDDAGEKPTGAASVLFTNGELHPLTTVKAVFRDVSATGVALVGDSPGHTRGSEAYNPEERQNPKFPLFQTPHSKTLTHQPRRKSELTVIAVLQNLKVP